MKLACGLAARPGDDRGLKGARSGRVMWLWELRGSRLVQTEVLGAEGLAGPLWGGWSKKLRTAN